MKVTRYSTDYGDVDFIGNSPLFDEILHADQKSVREAHRLKKQESEIGNALENLQNVLFQQMGVMPKITICLK